MELWNGRHYNFKHIFLQVSAEQMVIDDSFVEGGNFSFVAPFTQFW